MHYLYVCVLVSLLSKFLKTHRRRTKILILYMPYNNTMSYLIKVIVIVLTLIVFGNSEVHDQLKVGFYDGTCPPAESIVRSVVRQAIFTNVNMAAILLRLHFHDCFVEGCDGSILIENDANSERNANGHQGVGGFEVIEKAKAELESVCPGIVSCADIVALAARDAIFFSQGPGYEVPTGRRDGRVSNIFLANDMPDVGDSVQQLKDKFSRKGLTPKDLVVLSAAHTIGTTACFFMRNRLYNFFPGGGSDPSINPSFLPILRAQCPPNGDVNARLPIDMGSERLFDDHILRNIKNGFAVLETDAKLRQDPATSSVIDSYFGLLNPIFGPSFRQDFVESMIKMGQIGVKTGFQSEIRQTCSRFN